MKPSRSTVRRVSLGSGTVMLFLTLVVFEPTRLADMAIASIGLVLVLYGLYDLRRVEDASFERARKEMKAIEGSYEYASETESLPRKDPFDVDDG